MSADDLLTAPVSDQMTLAARPSPPGHAPLPPALCPSALCPSAATLFFLPSAYSLLFLTSLPGNALSLWVFLRRVGPVSPVHVYLSHLSVSNLLLSLATPFLAAYYAGGWAWSLRGAPCQLVLHGVTPVLHSNIYISIMILTWVALSRFAALIRHTHAARPSGCATLLPRAFFARLTRTAFASRVCAAVWVLALGCTVPVSVYYSVNEAMGDDGVAAAGSGRVQVCYNAPLEIGGGLCPPLALSVITVFFGFYLLVLLSYTTVLRHIRRSQRSTSVTASQSMLGRALRNIVLIQVVLSVSLLPYHIFKPIFISLADDQRQLTASPDGGCHPLSGFVELKNCLLLLVALRGSADPLMYFLLDKSFRHQTLRLFSCSRNSRASLRANQKAAQLEQGDVATATGDVATATGDVATATGDVATATVDFSQGRSL